uniref:Down syndrome cell adhesion molecule-like protein Dscam2 n=1 Tax=Diabrotica virgifera virgifera TaxID=50390 RepID=A0A6P7GL15_DIAVI
MLLASLYFVLLAASVRAEDDTTAGPVFLKEPPNRVDFSNTTGAVVECSARGNPPPDIIWVRADGSAVGDVPGLRQVLANGNLVFPPFRAEDYRQEVHAQVYACLAKNTEGSIHSRDVNVRAVVSQVYAANVMDESVLKGNTAIFKCHIPSFVSDYVSVTSWMQDDGHEIGLQDGSTTTYDSKYLVLPSGELHIKDVGPEDGYKSYQCRTKHRLTGETRLSATKGRLVITEPTNNVPPKKDGRKSTGWKEEVRQNATAWLTCQVSAYPVPRYL